jgi:hypothetical protein
MDTIQDGGPVGAEGATSSQDTSQIDAQPTDTDVSVSDAQTEEVGDAQPLLAGKYKSPEELEKAYKSLESKLGETGQKAALVSKLEQSTGMTAQQIEAYISQQQQERIQQERLEQDQQIQENPGAVAYQELQKLKSQMAYKEEQNALDSFLNSPEGQPYKEHKEKIFEAALYLPSYRGKNYSDIANELFGTVRAQGQNDAYKKIEKKIQSQTTGVNQGAQPRKITPEDMKSMSVDELRAILPNRG